MSNFICEKCGTICYDSPNGYITGCEHYPTDVEGLSSSFIRLALEQLTQLSQDLGLYEDTDNPMIRDESVKNNTK